MASYGTAAGMAEKIKVAVDEVTNNDLDDIRNPTGSVAAGCWVWLQRTRLAGSSTFFWCWH
jgi:hypothetical protein